VIRSHYRAIQVGVWILAFVIVAGFAGISRAACPEYPKVKWWGNLTHAATIKLIAKNYDGKWAGYLDKWKAQLVKLEDISQRGSAIVVTKDKIRLEGEDLTVYISKVGERIAVIGCLAEEAAAK